MTRGNEGCPWCGDDDVCPGEHCLVEESVCRNELVAAIVEMLESESTKGPHQDWAYAVQDAADLVRRGKWKDYLK